MRVLWFTNTPSLYAKHNGGYNGGGWIEALEKKIIDHNDIKLGISFFYLDKKFKQSKNKITYYPISLPQSIFRKIKNIINPSIQEKLEIEKIRLVVNDFKPDIIHVFGSEKSFGLISREVEIPVVLHLQGILNSCLNAFYPPGINLIYIILKLIKSPFRAIRFAFGYRSFIKAAERELKIFKGCKYYMGRTEWDKNIIGLISPGSKYYYCSEMLRPVFYNYEPISKKNEGSNSKIHDIYSVSNCNKEFIIISTISSPLYKGFDIIHKTAKLLLSYSEINFEWRVFGDINNQEIENIYGICLNQLHISLKGIATAEKLIGEFANGDMFVHSSYIDNSSNSVCEAQMQSLPVIATNVGGMASLVKHEITGLLYPSNDPFSLAFYILRLIKDKEFAKYLGENARSEAIIRHDKDKIIDDLMSIYQNIIHNTNNI